MDSILALVPRYGAVAIATLLAASVVVPVPDDALLLLAGSLVAEGQLGLRAILAAGFVGSAIGMSVSYGLGRRLGEGLVLRLGRFVHLDAERLDAARAWYLRWGKYGVFFGYFVPGLRHVAAFLAGSSGLGWPSFAIFGYAGGVLWASTMIGLGYAFGAEWARSSVAVHRVLVTALSVGALVGGVVLLLRRRRRA
jgi:membrane protein DedA with SNARE-associated domain